MPLGLTLGTLACSASWTTYALLVGDATIGRRRHSQAKIPYPAFRDELGRPPYA